MQPDERPAAMEFAIEPRPGLTGKHNPRPGNGRMLGPALIEVGNRILERSGGDAKLSGRWRHAEHEGEPGNPAEGGVPGCGSGGWSSASWCWS